MKLEFKLEGAKELAAMLRELPERVARRVSNNSLRAGARVIRDEAKTQVPVLTGHLRDSIKVITGRTGTIERQQVHVGVFGQMSGLAHIIEFGTGPRIAKDPDGFMTFVVNGQFVRKRAVAALPARPFLRPAADSKVGEALNRIGNVLGDGIEKEALKLGGGPR